MSYSVGGASLHFALRAYEDATSRSVRARLAEQLAAVLWRFLLEHERGLAAAAGVTAFDVVTTVPATRRRAEADPLRRLVADRCGHTRGRTEQLLVSIPKAREGRRFDPQRSVQNATSAA